MSEIFGLLIAGAVLFLVVFGIVKLVGCQNMKKVGTVIGSQSGQMANNILKADPIAVLQHEIDKATGEFKKLVVAISDIKKVTLSLDRKIHSDQTYLKRMQSRFVNLKAKGEPELLSKTALKMNEIETRINANQVRQAEFQKKYDDHIRLAKTIEEQIAGYREKAVDMKVQLQMSEVDKQISSFQTQVSSIAFDTIQSRMSDAEDLVNDKIDANQAIVETRNQLSDADEVIEINRIDKATLAEELVQKYSQELTTTNKETSNVN